MKTAYLQRVIENAATTVGVIGIATAYAASVMAFIATEAHILG
jgi:hypothetical protein